MTPLEAQIRLLRAVWPRCSVSRGISCGDSRHTPPAGGEGVTPEERAALFEILGRADIWVGVVNGERIGLDPRMLAELVRAAVAEEREGCAKVAETTGWRGAENIRRDIASAIRARP